MFLALITFFIVLSVLVIVHELGHFLTAKKAGIKVEEFGLGYPPRIWGKKIGGTVYSINAIPFGGFVRLFGEELAEEETRLRPSTLLGASARQAFWAKSKKARTAVILAGVLANFLLGIIAFSIVYSVLGIPTKTDQISIVGVAPNSPAEKADLREEDVIFAINGQLVKDLEQFTQLIDEKKGEEAELSVKRGGESFTLSIVPREESPEGEGALGIVISNMEMKKYPFWQMPFRGAVVGCQEAFSWTKLILGSLGKMVGDLIGGGKLPRDIAGPIGIFQVTGAVAQTGLLNVIHFSGILSINLVVLNILPLPALDGGRMIFILYELLARRRPRPSFERWINAAGMAFLLALIVLVTINDLARLIDFKSLWFQLQSFFPRFQ